MKYRLFKDRRRRLLFSLFEPRRNTLRSLVENLSLPSSLRGQAYRALLLLPRDSSPTRRRNRCTLTGRSRSILRHFGLSRLRFRKLALEGKLVGIKKATWLLHLFLSMSTLTNNVYKPRYTIAYLASSKV